MPLFAFAPFGPADHRFDLAILLAAAFLLLSLPALARSFKADRARALFAGTAIVVPLLALIPPRDPTFSLAHFALSLAHWWVISGFFLAAGTLVPAQTHRRLLIRLNLVAGIVVAAYAVYQAFGHSRGWPGAGDLLFPFQRSPFVVFGQGDYVRPSSFFLEPRYMGGYLAWIALLALAASVSGRYRVRSALASLALSLAVFGVAMSLSWGAYADLLAVLSVAALQIRTLSRGSRLRLTRLGAALAVVLLVAGATPLRQALVGRLERLSRTPIDPAVSVPDPDSLRSRVINLRHTVLLFETAPVTGIGIGQFRVRTGAPPGSYEESPWCGWAASAALFGPLGPLLVAAGPLRPSSLPLATRPACGRDGGSLRRRADPQRQFHRPAMVVSPRSRPRSVSGEGLRCGRGPRRGAAGDRLTVQRPAATSSKISMSKRAARSQEKTRARARPASIISSRRTAFPSTRSRARTMRSRVQRIEKLRCLPTDFRADVRPAFFTLRVQPPIGDHYGDTRAHRLHERKAEGLLEGGQRKSSAAR